MANLTTCIMIGFQNFPLFAVIATLPIVIITMIQYKAVNLVRMGLDYALLLYFLCVIALVFFPLPTAVQAAALNGYHVQLIPFHFIADIIRESTFSLTNPATYLPSITNQVVLQVIYNVLMTVPFGMFLRYCCKTSAKKIVVATFLLSLIIEVTQLTGIFGVYHGSYRLCDVDDLIANTFGGYLGYRMVYRVESIVPGIRKFDIRIHHRYHA